MKIKVEFEMDVPDGISDHDLMEWLRYELHANGSMSGSNPLCDREIEADFMSVNYQVVSQDRRSQDQR